jgi:hypothetical protein
MPSRKYEDFDSSAKKATATKVLVEASSAVTKANTELGKESDKATKAFEKWFGTATSADMKTIKGRIQKMAYQFGHTNMKVVYSNACAVGENARMIHFNYTAANITSQISAAIKAGGNEGSMTLCERLFDLPYKSRGPKQSQVQCVIHEMSHFAAGAVDVQVNDAAGTLVTCYEALSQTLMTSAGGQFNWGGATTTIVGGKAAAMVNAENIGFFCMEFLY